MLNGFLVVLFLIFTALAAFASYREPNTGIKWWLLPIAAIPSPLAMFIRDRRMTEDQWRKERAELDERRKIIMGKAAMVSCAAGIFTLLCAMLYIQLCEGGDETAIVSMSIIMVVMVAAFMVSGAVFNKKM